MDVVVKELQAGIEALPLKEAVAFIKARSGLWYGFQDDCFSSVLPLSLNNPYFRQNI